MGSPEPLPVPGRVVRQALDCAAGLVPSTLRRPSPDTRVTVGLRRDVFPLVTRPLASGSAVAGGEKRGAHRSHTGRGRRHQRCAGRTLTFWLTGVGGADPTCFFLQKRPRLLGDSSGAVSLCPQGFTSPCVDEAGTASAERRVS